MLSVRGLVRSRVLLRLGGPAGGLVRWAGPAEARARSVSGVGGASGPAAGWYGGLSDSAPVHLCEHFLVGVQQVSGLPWWLSIVMATVSVRTFITLPLAAYQLLILSKVGGANSHLEGAVTGSRLTEGTCCLCKQLFVN